MMEIVRTLRPTGKAIVSVPNAWEYTDHHFFDFNLSAFRDLVQRFFGRAQFYSQDPQGSSTQAFMPKREAAADNAFLPCVKRRTRAKNERTVTRI